MLNESDAIFIDGRWYLKADALPANIKELAVVEKVNFRIIDGKPYLESIQMLDAIRRDTCRLNGDTERYKRLLKTWKRQHPFRYVWMKINTGASWLFGFDV